MLRQPTFLITIDTEGDNLWASPREITTVNAKYLLRFQVLCEKYGFKPTYLTNHEMVMDDYFAEFGRDVIRRGTGEIGMHLHAWNSPPVVPLTTDDIFHHPYLIEYPDAIMDEKIAFMTDLLEDRFQTKMLSHRAGRWAFDARYARLLVKHGYTVDCSVTPGVSWRRHLGAPGGNGGSDYRHFPTSAYFIDLDDVSKPGKSQLLELPVTIRCSQLRRAAPLLFEGGGYVTKIVNKVTSSPQWLRPNSRNRAEMLEVVEGALLQGAGYIEFMLHSSEFMPGGSPTFPDEHSIELLYEDIERLFERIAANFVGATLNEYRGREFVGKDSDVEFS